MSIPTFNGVAIWGQATRLQPPQTEFRALQETIPGVAGVRRYRMGRSGVTWTITGRVTYSDKDDLGTHIYDAMALINGAHYTFVDTFGFSFANCTLTNFTTVGEVQPATDLNGDPCFTVRVTGTVQWDRPTW